MADAGAPDAAGATRVDIPWLAAGMPPVAPPVLTPCPAGWREVAEADATTCDPWPEAGPATCPEGEAQFPGDPGCARIGPACPADGLPADLPSDRPAVYILAGATGGDGSRAHPYGALTDVALDSLTAGTIIALGRGRYDTTLRLARGVSVWGACVAQTELVSSTRSSTEGVVTILGAGSELRSLTIRDSLRTGVWVDGGGRSVDLQGVWVDHVEMLGLSASNGGAITGREIVVRQTQARPSDGLGGRALSAQDRGTLRVARALLQGNHESAAYAVGSGAELTLQDTAIRDTEARSIDLELGRGVSVEEFASAELTRVVIEGSRDTGLAALATATLSLADVVVRDTLSQPRDSVGGTGIRAEDGSTVEIVRSLLERNREAGVQASGAGAVVHLTDVVVRDVDVRESDGIFGDGLALFGGAAAVVTRGVFARNHDVGVLATGTGTTLQISDATVSDTASRRDGSTGAGLVMQHGASGRVERVLTVRNRSAGLVLDGDGATSVTLADVAVRDTLSRDVDGALGRGLSVQRGVTVDATRVLVSGAREVGLIVLGAGAELRATQLVVEATSPATCVAAGTCGDQALGIGVGTYEGAHASLSYFAIRDSALCGLQVALDGALDLSDGEVVGNAIGACVQVADYDLARLSDRVSYRDNGSAIQATELPVPDATPHAFE